eukprot:9484687-Pyramimonas_sp.AAC.1
MGALPQAPTGQRASPCADTVAASTAASSDGTAGSTGLFLVRGRGGGTSATGAPGGSPAPTPADPAAPVAPSSPAGCPAARCPLRPS